MSKPPLNVIPSNRGQRFAQSGVESGLGPSRDATQKGLDLRPAMLDRREVGRIGGQEFHPRAHGGNGVGDGRHLMGRDIVHKHDSAGVQAGDSHLLGEDEAGVPLYRPWQTHRCPHRVRS